MVFRGDTSWRLIALVLLTGTVAIAVRAWVVHRAATSVTATSAVSLPVSSAEEPPVRTVPDIPSSAWGVLVQGGRDAVASGSSHEKYRLAGTFFLMGSGGGDVSGQRLAIIDDVEGKRQHIVSEGMSFDGHEILRIHADRLIMRRDGVEIELTLSFKDGVGAVTGATTTASNETVVAETVLETSRFGKRIGEARWVMQKQALFDYYRELLDNPERIASIYMSMKPDYVQGEVAGYRLEKEGESDFFDAVGLREGDTIRRVNSMNMTSQARAEYFISEFMKERLGAVVLDIEREGKPEKLIYLFR